MFSIPYNYTHCYWQILRCRTAKMVSTDKPFLFQRSQLLEDCSLFVMLKDVEKNAISEGKG